MAVFCAKCGEELLGAINRCWRCGTTYESRSGNAHLPPVRRAPIKVPLFGPLEGEALEDESAAGHDPADRPEGEVEPSRETAANSPGGATRDHAEANAEASAGADAHAEASADAGREAAVAELPRMRRGSPFRSADATQASDSAVEFALAEKPPATVYPKHGGASAGAVVAITLGLIGLGLAKAIPPAGLLVAAMGLGMGIWGLYSKKRRAAICGLLLCCLAVTISGFFCAAELYRVMSGQTPW